MFVLTESAKEELQNRMELFVSAKFIRLQMRKSCFMKVKVTIEESVRNNDSEVVKDGLHFIIDNGEAHYFRNKKLDYLADHTGFKQFDML